MRKKENDEKYVKNLIKEINAKNELLKKTAELIKKKQIKINNLYIQQLLWYLLQKKTQLMIS